MLALQREHHDAIKRVAAQQKLFRERSNSTMDLTPSRINDKRKGRRNKRCLDFAAEINARALLDELIKLEHSKWLRLSEERDAKLVESFHSLFLAESGMWTKFSHVFERMKRICVYYAKAVAEANAVGAAAKLKTFEVDGSESRISARRRSVTAQSDQAFASKQQKLLIFQNPETNIVICKHRLKLLKRWHYLSQISLKLWLELRENELNHVRACIEWLTHDGHCHALVRNFSFYEMADGTAPAHVVSKRDYISMLKGWMDILKTSPMAEANPGNNLNLAKPLMVVQNCLQYVERTLFNVNEREKLALDQVKKLAVATGKTNFFSKSSQDEPRIDAKRPSIISKPNAPPSSHATEAMRHKLDKTLVENRVFRRTKLAKCQTELWRGLEFCTKFMGTLYFYLGSEHKAKLPFRFEDDDGSVTFGIPSPSVQLRNESENVASVVSAAVNESTNSFMEEEPEKSLLSSVEIPIENQRGSTSLSSLLMVPSLQPRLSISKRLVNTFPKSMTRIHPEESQEEFNGLSSQDEKVMISQAALILHQIDTTDTSLRDTDEFDTDATTETAENPANIPSFVFIRTSTVKSVEKSVLEERVHKPEELPQIEKPDIPIVIEIETAASPPNGAISTPFMITSIMTNGSPINPETNDQPPPSPKKKHKKKKRQSSKVPPDDAIDPTSPSAPPADLVGEVEPLAKKHRHKKSSSHKRSKGPPPPPPINPAAAGSEGLGVPVSRLNAPMMTVSSASMTNTRLITALSNGDISMQEVPRPDELPQLHASSSAAAVPSANVAPLPPPVARTPSLTSNILDKELKALAPRAISPEVSVQQPVLPLPAVTATAVAQPQHNQEPACNRIAPSPLKAIESSNISNHDEKSEPTAQQPQKTVSPPQLPGLGQLSQNYGHYSNINSNSNNPHSPLQRSNSSLEKSDRRAPPPVPIPTPAPPVPIPSKKTVSRSSTMRSAAESPITQTQSDRPTPTTPSRGASMNALLSSNFDASKSDFFRLPKTDKHTFGTSIGSSSSHRGSVEQLQPTLSAEYYRIPKTETTQKFRQSISRRGSVEHLNEGVGGGATKLNALTSGGARTKSQLFRNAEESSTTTNTTDFVLHSHHRRPAPEPPRQPYPLDGASGNVRGKNLLGAGGGALRNHALSSSKSVL
ncbi:hypothetical protein BDR26DRAFT_868110 [Obelidium mucronatum]|nr:hypothetical protein BDR26DRAFT_868110 [Obelidium mucronatum]